MAADLTAVPLAVLLLRAEALLDGARVLDRLPVTETTRAEVANIADEVRAIRAEVRRRSVGAA
jgi:hypothetical protein